MAEIDCKHFNFGEGRCPFVNSCFYKHALRDGTQAVGNLTNLHDSLHFEAHAYIIL